MIDLIQSGLSGLLLGGVFALAAVGLTLVFGVMDVVNFAHGEFVMLGMYIGFFSWSLFGLDPLLSIPIAAVVLAVVGTLVYQGVIRPVLGRNPLAQVIVTFGLLVFLRGLAQFLWTPNERSVQNTIARGLRFEVGGVVVGGPQFVAAVGALLCTAAVAWFIHRTEVGRGLQAAGEDPGGAALMGINPDRMYALSWLLAGGTTGVAGALLINQFSVSPVAGATFGLISFVAVALGGFGSVAGAALAGLMIGVVYGVVGLYASAYATAAALAIYLVVVVARPQGLRGTR
ncbi:MAG TPA: branched-chain amino acid ABC transporter permease [Mycobacteriales bacterium]|nr:branched-chain amino acid ABC transporter permease [Mycobacteriales bacterium]